MCSTLLLKGTVKQRGLVFLALVIIMALTFIGYVVSEVSINRIQSEQFAKTQHSLKQAKQALISYAISHMDRPGDEGEMGFLPCPDVGPTAVGNEGKQSLNCATQYLNSIGYLPWKSLDIPSLRDSSGNCLLYAVSNTYKLNPTNLLNDDSNGMFQVVDDTGAVKSGVLPENRIVAIVFSPGVPLAGQSRNFNVGTDCGMDYNLSAFLEGNGVTNNSVLSAVDNKVDQFIHMTANSALAALPYNDKFITISRDDIWSAIISRNDFIPKMTDLTEALAECLVEYSKSNSDRRLPWPAPMALNNSNYRKDGNYDDNNGGLYAGRFPFNVDDSNIKLGVTLSNMFEKCDTLPISSGTVVDLKDTNKLYRKLWENWKDHFFYMLSKEYKPGTGGPRQCGDCNKVGTKKYSAIVVFSGLRFGLDLRADVFSGDNDDKSNISNYLENGNDIIFSAANGKDNYNKVGAPVTSNDIMFCVTNEITSKKLKVEPC